MRILLFFLPVSLVFGLLWIFDATQLLGAHPWWSRQVLIYGLIPGFLLAWAAYRTGLTHRIRIALPALLALAAFGTASWGKAQFAASFAENTLAGQVWFYGWIAACAFAAAACAAIATPDAQVT